MLCFFQSKQTSLFLGGKKPIFTKKVYSNYKAKRNIMKTIIVPVDFSETSNNAARYAAQMATQLGTDKVILYNTYGGSYQILDNGADAVYNSTAALLKSLVDELKRITGEQVTYEWIAGDGFLLDEVEVLVKKHQAGLIVMGITGKNTVEQKLVGSNTYRVATEASCPVLIVPAQAKFEDIKRVGLSMKFKAGLMEETPDKDIKQLINDLGAELIILNVADEDHRTNPQNIQSAITAAHLMFDDEKTTAIEFIDEQKDIVKGISELVEEKDIQILIAITHKLGFLQSLFRGSITKKLAFYTTVPLLVFRAIEK